MTTPVALSLAQARRLAYRGQHLSGPRVGRDRAGLLRLVRALGCLQLDPISVVARTHLLVTWSRVGRFDPTTLRRLQEVDKDLFEFWAHAASLVAASNMAIHRHLMRVAYTSDRVYATRVRQWLDANAAVAADIVTELTERGPLRTQDLSQYAVQPCPGIGWNDAKSVSILLEHLSARGTVLVARRDGTVRWWDLGSRCVPPDVSTEELPEAEVVRRAAAISVRALGVATAAQISRHFTRGLYPHLPDRLRELVSDGVLVPATVDGLKGEWYLHADDRHDLAALPTARLTLLSPFDNLICDRDRTEALWGFRYRLEVYTPAAKRQYGYYVLPVLDGDRMVGRIDAALDTRRGLLQAKAVHVEPGVRSSRRRTAAIRRRFEDLGRFVGADGIDDPTGALSS